MTHEPADKIIVGEIERVTWLQAQKACPARTREEWPFNTIPAQPALPRRVGSIMLTNGMWFNFPEDGSLILDFTPRKGMAVEIERCPVMTVRLAEPFEPLIVKTNVLDISFNKKGEPWRLTTGNPQYRKIKFLWGWQPDFHIVCGMWLEIDVEIGRDRDGNPCFETQSIRQVEPDFDDALHRMLIAAKVPSGTLKKLEAVLGSEWASIVRDDKDRLFEGAEFKRVHASTKDKIWQVLAEHAKSTATHRALLEAGLDSKLLKRAHMGSFLSSDRFRMV